MSPLLMVIIILLILLLVGVFPAWPHSVAWGYNPAGLVGLILVVVIVLFLIGRV